ncbi:acyl-CoA dehydrogenase family protein [Dactylosporangium sp. NPDC000555]|uniref:acyl-CoA dehydrogenase family protein n=1 Tax=Dactylosporangium sp. NPDC000555 TaxID=3154260 RepID=UPI00332D2185
MDFEPSEAQRRFRTEVRQFLAELPPATSAAVHDSGTLHSWSVHRAMAERGWLAAAWPADQGGQGRDPFEMATLNEEFARAGIPIEGWLIAELVAKTLQIVGTEQQRREVIPAILSGEILMCLGYSEPDSGSDVAAARTRAIRDGDEWVIEGQKMFTTMAHEATYVFLLARTNPDVSKHRGLTMFLVPLDAEGVEVRPVHTLGGERTNATFYERVRVPDSARVGEVDGGWDVMMVALAFERQPAAAGHLLHLVDRAIAWARTPGADGHAPIERPEVRACLARAYTDLEVSRLMGYRMTWLTARDVLPHTEGSLAKLFSSEALMRAASSFVDILGADGLLAGHGTEAPADGWIEHEFRHSVVTTIYAGTSEIQRGIIAERHLGLPRAQARRAST